MTQDERRPLGICLSGGGIRAAAYGLGALQALGEHGVMPEADFLAAVSGGSYIAGAAALVAAGNLSDGNEVACDGGTVVTPEGQAPFARRSPEEDYLRHHLEYLVHGPGGKLAVVGRALFGLVLNLGFLALPLWFVSVAVGWLYGWASPYLRDKANCQSASRCGTFHVTPDLWLIVGAFAVAGALAGLLWVGVSWKRPDRRQRMGRVCALLMGGALALLVGLIVMPYVIEWLRGGFAHRAPLTPATSSPTQGAAVRSGAPSLGIGALAGLGGLVATVGTVVARAVRQPASEQAAEGWLRQFLGRHRTAVLNLVATVAGPVLVVLLTLLGLDVGAAHVPGAAGGGSTVASLLVAAVPLVAWLLTFLLDLNSWSLHPYYKEHLSEAFALARTTRGAAERRYEVPYAFSTCRPKVVFPELLVCATANVTAYGATPTGFNAAPFVFSVEDMGGDLVGRCKAADYERLAPRRITIPAAVAVSGAAISPEMGKMTKPALRFVMAAANVRLGVWLPNPALASAHPERVPRRPSPLYLYRELLGRQTVDSPYLYVTDGGHYDNLGLVELLRRRCGWIFCVDASGEKQDSFGTIGQALALARAELGIDVGGFPVRAAMAPEPVAPDTAPPVPSHPDLRYVKSVFTHGTLRYPDGQQVHLVIVKAGVPADAPADIQAFLEDHPNFPCDPTSDQLFGADTFDAYRALGEFSTATAFAAVRSDYNQFVATGKRPARP